MISLKTTCPERPLERMPFSFQIFCDIREDFLYLMPLLASLFGIAKPPCVPKKPSDTGEQNQAFVYVFLS